ncbi:MAG: DNA adenine methylase [Bacteroidetes bacterium]|nr:DNA adenine methylase [Bacteroidota bacterium]
MNYIGSKYKLSSFIVDEITRIAVPLERAVFAELFGGTGAVARRIKTKAKEIIVNDTEAYAYALLRHYIGNTKILEAHEFIERLNALQPIEGFIFNNYCAGSGSGRNYFTDWNGKKIDVMRSAIERWKENNSLTEDMYYFLLASLIECADALANTASVYGAYLKHIKMSAAKPMVLRAALHETSRARTQVYQEDANKLIKQIKGDILYLDPPYNHRQYGANYHLLNTIALNDTFEPKGKTGLRPDYNRSAYCSRSQVAEAFDHILSQADFEFIFISYNNEGLLDETALKKICNQYGSYQLIRKSYQRFRADKQNARNHIASRTEEHLHVLIKK